MLEKLEIPPFGIELGIVARCKCKPAILTSLKVSKACALTFRRSLFSKGKIHTRDLSERSVSRVVFDHTDKR
jgi:hypothetical protein